MAASDKVKQTAKDEAKRVSAIAQNAAQSGAYLYPLKVTTTRTTIDTH